MSRRVVIVRRRYSPAGTLLLLPFTAPLVALSLLLRALWWVLRVRGPGRAARRPQGRRDAARAGTPRPAPEGRRWLIEI